MSDNALIKVKDLYKHYKDGVIKALDGVTVDIEKGEVVVIIGPSGSGKSTLLRSLNLLEYPTGGSIVFDDVEITAPKAKLMRNLLRFSSIVLTSAFPYTSQTPRHCTGRSGQG